MEIEIPGSKSITNRALILAALCRQKIEIHNFASSTDSHYMTEALSKLGYMITKNKQVLTIEPCLSKISTEIYTHNAGTTTRFLTAFCTLLNSEITITGDTRMSQRPISALTTALNQLGAKISTTSECPPVTISAQIPKGGNCKIPGEISSQYLSGILMIAPFLEKNTTISIIGELCSKPYVDLTIALMESFGLSVKNNNYQSFKIKGKQIPSPQATFTVEADASSASYIGALSLITKKTITIKNLQKKSLQGDIEFIDLLEKMGAKIVEKDNNITINAPEKLKTLGEIDMNHIPDLVMTFSVLAPLTKGKTRINNIANLRIKECDRLKALKAELQKLGVKVHTGPDWIEIEGPYKINKPTEIETYEDHRIALAFGMLTSIFPEVKIQNPEVVEKSFTSFWQQLNKIQNES